MRDDKPHDMDEPVKIDLDPETVLRELLKVDPESPRQDDEPPKDD
jgi:hypothetical protein